MAAEPVGEGRAFGQGAAVAGGVQHRQEGAREGGFFERREVRVAQQRGGEVQRRGQARVRFDQAAAAAARVEHGDAEGELVADEISGTGAFEQGVQGGATAHRDVLAVVEQRAAARILEGEGLAAGVGAAFEQEHAMAGFGQVERRGEAGEAGADDEDRRHAGYRGGSAARTQSSARRAARRVREGETRRAKTS